MINEGDGKDEDEVFWDASDKKSKEWKETVRMGYRQRDSKKKTKKALRSFLCHQRKDKGRHRGGKDAAHESQVKGKEKSF